MGLAAPVIVIMAKQPAVGRTKTRLCPPLTPAEATALYDALLRDTIDLVAGLVGVQLAIAVTPPEAVADFRAMAPPDALLIPVSCHDIGDCLQQALADVLAAGHSRAFCLNSDGPTLPQSYLYEALSSLDQADVVLGPSEDGGYYLIGLKQPCPRLFAGIEWSTDQVRSQTLARARMLGMVVAELPPWYDVDTAADLERLRIEVAVLLGSAIRHTRGFLATCRPPSRR